MKTCIAAIALAAALPAAAAEPATAVERVLSCADITDAAARLACFDRSAAAAREPRAPATPANPPTQPKAPAEVETLQAHITATRKASGGLYLIILDNGQTWRHESGSMEPYLKVGEAVTIRKGSLGSHRLTLDSGQAKNWVRVTRVR
jgi:hypothetical protein